MKCYTVVKGRGDMLNFIDYKIFWCIKLKIKHDYGPKL